MHEQYTPSTPWLAASHLASGCNKTRETSISTGCNIHQMINKVSDAVPVHAVQVSVVNKCKMWFSLRDEKKKRHAEQNVASGNVLVSISLFPFFVFYSTTSSRAHIKFVDDLKFSSFPSSEFGGGVSATWNNEMSFLKLAVFFFSAGLFWVYFVSLVALLFPAAHTFSNRTGVIVKQQQQQTTCKRRESSTAGVCKALCLYLNVRFRNLLEFFLFLEPQVSVVYSKGLDIPSFVVFNLEVPSIRRRLRAGYIWCRG